MGEHEARPKPAVATGNSPTSKPLPKVSPSGYLNRHAPKVWHNVENYLKRADLAPPSPRVVWKDEGSFVHHTVEQLQKMELFARRESLLEVLYPADPYAAIEPLLPFNTDGYLLLSVWVPTSERVRTASGTSGEQLPA